MGLHFPSDCPASISAKLDALSALLSDVPAPVLAAICKWTSGYGEKGLGINPEGFGGYFGQHVGWAYPTRPQGFTRTELLDPSTFTTQATVAAATLAGYKLATLGESLECYVSGHATDPTTPFVAYVCEATGADASKPLTQQTTPPVPPPLPQEVDMKYGIVVYETPETEKNGEWAVFVTAGQVVKRHIPTPTDVTAMEQLGAVALSGGVWTVAYIATLPTVPTVA